MNWRRSLDRFNFSSTDGPEPSERINELERLIGVPLPTEYRHFLVEVGGGHVDDVVVPCTVPTPFGEHIVGTVHSANEVINLLDSVIAPRNMICITYGNFGMTGCLSIAGLDHGQVFSLDTESRFFWKQSTLKSLPDLDPSIKEFFRLRDADELPERPWGYENCYHVANSLSEFIEKMRAGNE